LISIWAISGLAAGAIGLLAGIKMTSIVDEAKLARKEQAWAEERAQAATLTAEWQGKARQAIEERARTERTWLEAARSIDRDGIQQADKLRTAVARADAANVGLSAQLGAVVADAARAAEASASAADARERQIAAETARMLSELLGRCHGRSTAVARFADAAADAGSACERWATELTKP
jgi:NADH dehydrogenase/NADH:ubiquinone oxidoreductase subunit G